MRMQTRHCWPLIMKALTHSQTSGLSGTEVNKIQGRPIYILPTRCRTSKRRQTKAHLELRHVLFGEDVEGLFSCCQGRQSLVQACLAFSRNGVGLVCFSGNTLSLGIHLQPTSNLVCTDLQTSICPYYKWTFTHPWHIIASRLRQQLLLLARLDCKYCNAGCAKRF